VTSRNHRRSPANRFTTVREAIETIDRRFQKARLYYGHGTDNARDEAAWLVASRLRIPFAELDASSNRRLSPVEQQTVSDLAENRIRSRKPLAYLLSEAWFAGHRFYVDERVIVPRSVIGEFLRDCFRPWVDPDRITRVLDLCTGSGCIAIAAALAFPHAKVDAVDISTEALQVARINVDTYGLGNRIDLIQSDLFASLGSHGYDLILTNPPYVDAHDMATLPPEYRAEPPLALQSGEQGLDAIRRILAQAADHLSPNGVVIAELGNSHAAMRKRFPNVDLTWLTSPSGDESVFLIDRERLLRSASTFRT